MYLLLILIYIIVVFAFAMIVITPYENDELQRNITLSCAFIYNLLYGAFILPMYLFAMNFIRLDYWYIKSVIKSNFLVPALTFVCSFILLNILFKNKLKMGNKEYLKWNILLLAGGFLIIMIL